jgi:two-component system, NarL family, sensor histidine kinase UhpB
VEDNGSGIETERLLNRESWGIVGMHERARYFGGQLKITGNSGHGTVVALRVPMKETDD